MNSRSSRMWDSADRAAFRRRLLKWFDKHQRDLPWRRNRTRYRVWISEIMLQQTQVVTVVDYFNRFIKRFPDVKTLARANQSQVLKLWEGLGYYRRARQLHAAAQTIVENHDGQFPDHFDQVLALPGIGRYTAGAILSIADDQPLPIVEGNTIRVYSRLNNFQDDVTSRAGQQFLWDFAESLVTRHRPGDLNQALMELGSETCTVKSPACHECPVHQHCLAFRQGTATQLPHKGGKKTHYQDLQQVAVIIQRKNEVVVRKCQPHEHWSGLWDFPRFTVEDPGDQNSISQKLKAQTGLTCSPVFFADPVQQLKHAVTRYRIRLTCYQVFKSPTSGRRSPGFKGQLKKIDELQWIPIARLNDLAMSTTGRKLAQWIARR